MEDRCPFSVGEIDKIPINQLFTQSQVRDRRDKLKVSMRKAVDKWYKNKYGDEF